MAEKRDYFRLWRPDELDRERRLLKKAALYGLVATAGFLLGLALGWLARGL